jgi:TRAP transporter TAXI family solute receptor
VLSIVARDGITDLDGLRGKTIDAGRPGSATRLLVDRILADTGGPAEAPSSLKTLPIDQRWRAFCEGRLDAMAYIAGQPNGLIEEAIVECGGQLVPLPTAMITRLVGQLPDYRTAQIPAGLYAEDQPAVATVGVDALVLGSTRLSENETYEIVAAVLGGEETLRRMQPAFVAMQAGDMIEQDDAVPQHPGAARFAAEMPKQP